MLSTIRNTPRPSEQVQSSQRPDKRRNQAQGAHARPLAWNASAAWWCCASASSGRAETCSSDMKYAWHFVRDEHVFLVLDDCVLYLWLE